MTKLRVQEFRQLCNSLAALQQHAALMPELSLIEKDHIQGAAEAIRSLLPIVESREMQELVEES